MTEIRDYDPADGDLCQGDVVLFRLPDGYIPSKTQKIAPRAGQLILAEGEMTGHHHAIWMSPAMFRDDGLARGLDGAPKQVREPRIHDNVVEGCLEGDAVIGIASLYRDDGLIQRLVSGGNLATATLAIGVLVVEGEPAVLRHQEHDPIRIPPGDYYVGRQQEFHAGEERRVAD